MRLLQASAAVGSVFGVATLGVGLWSTQAYLFATQAPVALAPALLSGRALPKCPNCGWIEDKRDIAPDVLDASKPKTYEYTLRMSDDSASLFRETMPTKWRLGERVMLIEGISAPD